MREKKSILSGRLHSEYGKDRCIPDGQVSSSGEVTQEKFKKPRDHGGGGKRIYASDQLWQNPPTKKLISPHRAALLTKKEPPLPPTRQTRGRRNKKRKHVKYCDLRQLGKILMSHMQRLCKSWTETADNGHMFLRMCCTSPTTRDKTHASVTPTQRRVEHKILCSTCNLDYQRKLRTQEYAK